MNHGEVSRFAVRAENELRIRIEACSIGVLPDWEGCHHRAGVRVHHHHFLVTADRKQSPILLIEGESRGLFAARERPAMKYRKLLRIDLKKFRLIFNIHKHVTFVVTCGKLRLPAHRDHAPNLAVRAVNSNRVAASTFEGETAFLPRALGPRAWLLPPPL